jgi:hypothetical protein
MIVNVWVTAVWFGKQWSRLLGKANCTENDEVEHRQFGCWLPGRLWDRERARGPALFESERARGPALWNFWREGTWPSSMAKKWRRRAPAVWLLTVRTTYDLEENSGWTSGPAQHWACVRTKLATLSLLTLKSVLGRAPAIWSLIVRTTRVEHRQSGCWLWGQLCMKILQGRAPTVRLWLSRRQVIWVRTVELRTASSDSDSV